MIAQIFSSTEPRVYLLGNPIVWWTNLAFLVLCPWVIFSVFYKTVRTENMSSKPLFTPHFWASSWLYIIWALHYFPFFFMFRTLYVHHYYPALYFSSVVYGMTGEQAKHSNSTHHHLWWLEHWDF